MDFIYLLLEICLWEVAFAYHQLLVFCPGGGVDVFALCGNLGGEGGGVYRFRLGLWRGGRGGVLGLGGVVGLGWGCEGGGGWCLGPWWGWLWRGSRWCFLVLVGIQAWV